MISFLSQSQSLFNAQFSGDLLDSVLLKLRLNAGACLIFFKLAASQPNFGPGVKSYCKLVHILSRPDDEAGDCAGCLQLLDHMVNAYCKQGRVDRAVEFVKETEHSGFELNVVSYNSLTDGYVSVGDMEGAYGVLKIMKANGVLRNEVGKMDEAEQIFAKMVEFGCKSDGITFRTVGDGYCKAGNVEEALEVKEKREKDAISPSVEMYNSLITALFKCGKVTGNVDEAFRLCDEMVNYGIVANITTYNALMNGLRKSGNMSRAQRLFDKLHAKDRRLSKYSCELMPVRGPVVTGSSIRGHVVVFPVLFATLSKSVHGFSEALRLLSTLYFEDSNNTVKSFTYATGREYLDAKKVDLSWHSSKGVKGWLAMRSCGGKLTSPSLLK
ncbi:unnamed protein product [Linum tenue]|uniref:Pentatricopeptide repeat-containing protein n=1 Tax=Linum tenue TaxID=586396 RepID=A0AAV0KVD2_9ROSI|nr:unnamed protein product [Linum tenue]